MPTITAPTTTGAPRHGRPRAGPVARIAGRRGLGHAVILSAIATSPARGGGLVITSRAGATPAAAPGRVRRLEVVGPSFVFESHLRYKRRLPSQGALLTEPAAAAAAVPARLTSENLHDPVLPWVDRNVVAPARGRHRRGRAGPSARQQSANGTVRYLYVVDDRDVLVGHVPGRASCSWPRRTRWCRSVMNDDVMAIPSWATVLVAAEYFVNRRLQAFPVIEDSGRLVGAVDAAIFTPEMRRLAEQSFDDIFQLAGISVTPSAGAWGGFVNRFPWLLCNIGGGLLAAALSSHYQLLLDQAIVLALFIPVVLALSESVSIQSVTLALQALHTGTLGMASFAPRPVARGRHGRHARDRLRRASWRSRGPCGRATTACRSRWAAPSPSR